MKLQETKVEIKEEMSNKTEQNIIEMERKIKQIKEDLLNKTHQRRKLGNNRSETLFQIEDNKDVKIKEIQTATENIIRIFRNNIREEFQITDDIMEKMEKDTNKHFERFEQESRATIKIMEKINGVVRNTKKKFIWKKK